MFPCKWCSLSGYILRFTYEGWTGTWESLFHTRLITTGVPIVSSLWFQLTLGCTAFMGPCLCTVVVVGGRPEQLLKSELSEFVCGIWRATRQMLWPDKSKVLLSVRYQSVSKVLRQLLWSLFSLPAWLRRSGRSVGLNFSCESLSRLQIKCSTTPSRQGWYPYISVRRPEYSSS